MVFFKNKVESIGVFIRVLIALIGGFVLANLVAIIISYIPADNKVDGIVMGMMIGFIVYTIAAMYVFSTKTAGKAGVVIGGCCLASYGVIAYLDTVVQ